MSDGPATHDVTETHEAPEAATTLTTPGGVEPLDDEQLKAKLDALPPGVRIENAIAQLGHAAYSVSFAKVAAPRLRDASDRVGHNPVGAGLDHLVVSVLQKAVVDTASLFDQTGAGSNSLYRALDVVRTQLKDSPPSPERDAAIDLVNEIQDVGIQNKTPELKYVRHMRNKWAAHSSMDISVDPWGPGKSVDFGMLELAIRQMQHHFIELVILIQQVPALEGMEREGRRIDEKTVRMGIDWDGFGRQALAIMGGHAENSARLLLDRIEPELMQSEP
ncbi:hypothetical protein [Arthrobacter sp. HMWF013]|uniref:hypothetical protein n=1 Tax=Arthrobacter sp. HMWF013 TaxID=2056849 RepID=UPI000D3CDE5E|nr:hypothetical protein [Arthrobacter sp. HMWF013]PTT69230.1 hypothetical protein DBR22_04470 [Arthrobacter sp. HMWF013]